MFVFEGYGNPTNSGHGEARCPPALAWSITEPRVGVAQPAAGAAPRPGPRGARSPHPQGLRDGGRGSGAAPPPVPPPRGSQCRVRAAGGRGSTGEEPPGGGGDGGRGRGGDGRGGERTGGDGKGGEE